MKMPPLKIFEFLLLFAIFVSCNSNESIDTLGEYDIPIDPKVKEMIYTYARSPENDTLLHHYLFKIDRGDSLITQFTYINDEILFERYYKISKGRKKLLTEFYYEYPGETTDVLERIEGEVINFQPVNNNKKYESLKVKISFTNSLGFRTVFEETDNYLSDTTLIWQNRLHDAIKFEYTASTNTFIKYFPFFGRWSEGSGVSYYARGIGLIKFDYLEDETKYIRELASIKKIE